MTFTHKEVVNINIVYEIDLQPYTWAAGFTLGNSFFGAVILIKNADANK